MLGVAEEAPAEPVALPLGEPDAVPEGEAEVAVPEEEAAEEVEEPPEKDLTLELPQTMVDWQFCCCAWEPAVAARQSPRARLQMKEIIVGV